MNPGKSGPELGRTQQYSHSCVTVDQWNVSTEGRETKGLGLFPETHLS